MATIESAGTKRRRVYTHILSLSLSLSPSSLSILALTIREELHEGHIFMSEGRQRAYFDSLRACGKRNSATKQHQVLVES